MRTIDIDSVMTLLKMVLTQMISHPQELVIEKFPLAKSLKITIQAHAADTGRLIGEGGANYNALVALMSTIGARYGIRVNIAPIKEPVVGESERYRFHSNPNWPKQNIMGLIKQISRCAFSYPDQIEVVAHDDAETLSTTIEVMVARNETEATVRVLQRAYNVLFDAIGKSNGRILYVDIVPQQDAEPAQPSSASGRFA